MIDIKYFMIRHLLSISIFITSWITFQSGLEFHFALAGLLAIGTYVVSNQLIKMVQSRITVSKYVMTLAEYRHIKLQLKEAKTKLKLLNGYYVKVRSVRAFKQLFEMNRLAKRIFQIVKTDPKKFYHVESFFYAHLETAVELTSKYTLLVTQPVKAMDVQIALQDTRETLQELNDVMEQDLRKVLSSDIEHLKMELDFAKISLKKPAPPLLSKGEIKNDRKTIGF
ncbi:5-bromo-4-chloroindolyl phosphate hydrolysis family protein [Paenisporosarcina sp. TG20]|uniref:5-bromo-4-chloroindolyl phosphate hydrolysis family protein n=1 Tax=Paenisporosarcina sp. TG20 TaxID=1211706 RepID=UPI000305E619|nr:5-bromo-4-chloroindolyl phosphate hydrolysis family protein [Paenisporosarcina sp. TG20]